MKQVKIADLKDRLSQHLRAVERGDTIEVTDRRRPIARIVPVHTGMAPQIQPAEIDVATFRRERLRPARWPVDSLTLLLQDRKKR
ncbi:MAG: type II toxin-antitoxin system prevent-host-death family antitoxin [Deltaproteobacteria bacterium]|nr:type II toxin-antitoxin system prevent-host-death family antitoxin [Deltaproteobacteria bacterium]